MNIGELKISLILEIIQADKNSKQFTASLKSLSTQEKLTTQETKLLNQSLNQTGQQTTKLSGVLTNAGLRFEGFLSVVRVMKSTLGEFFNEYNKFTSAQTGVSSVAVFKDINPQGVQKELMNLKAVKAGLLDVSSAATSMKNLLAANFTLEQSVELINRFSDSAAFGRQSSLSFGQAVSSATEGIKNGNSILVDNAGVTKNLSVMLEEAGFKAQDLMKAGQDTGVRMAIFNGILKETTGQLGDVDKLTKSSAGQMAKFDTTVTNLKIAFGKFIAEAVAPMLIKATDILKWLIDSPPAIQKLALTLVTLGAAFVVLNTSIGKLPYILIGLLGTSTALPTPLKGLAIALAAVAISMKLFNKDTLSLLGNLKSLGTSGASSVSSFATSAIGKFNLVGIAISLLIGWVTLLIDKLIDLDKENKNIEDWEKKRKTGSLTMTTPDGTEYDITDPKNTKKIETHSYVFDGKSFKGQETNEIAITSDQNIGKDSEVKPPKLNSTGTSPTVKELDIQISKYAELQKQLDEIEKKLILNAGYQGAINDLLSERKKIENEMNYLQTGVDINKILEDQKNAIDEQINAQIESSNLKKEQLKSELEAHLKAIDDIHSLKVELMENEHEKKLAQIEIERKIELDEIDSRNIPDEQKNELKKLTNKKFNKEKNDLGINLGDFNTALDLTQRIQSLLNTGSHTVLSKFLNALQTVQQIVALLQSLQLAQGIFSFISKIFGLALAPLTGGASVAGAVAGMPSGNSGGNLSNKFGQVINYISTNQTKVSKEPYFVSLKADGRNLKAVIKNVDKIDNARTK